MGISVTSEGNVLLLDNSPPMLSIHSADSSLLRSITLPPDMDSPRHVLETSSGNFIICHGDDESEYVLSQVSEVTLEGHVIRSFGGHLGVGEDLLYIPRYITLVPDNLIFVADGSNNRVMVIDVATFKLRRIIHCRDEKEQTFPLRLCYRPEKKQLIVGVVPHWIEVWSVE